MKSSLKIFKHFQSLPHPLPLTHLPSLSFITEWVYEMFNQYFLLFPRFSCLIAIFLGLEASLLLCGHGVVFFRLHPWGPPSLLTEKENLPKGTDLIFSWASCTDYFQQFPLNNPVHWILVQLWSLYKQEAYSSFQLYPLCPTLVE